MKATIVVVGSSNTDMIIKLDRIPKPGETLLGGGHQHLVVLVRLAGSVDDQGQRCCLEHLAHGLAGFLGPGIAALRVRAVKRERDDLGPESFSFGGPMSLCSALV